MNLQYHIVLEGQLGQRAGTLTLTAENGDVTGTFYVLGHENPVRGTIKGDTLELFHDLRTAVSVLPCRTTAELCGNELFGTVTTGSAVLRFSGEKIDTKGEPNEFSK